MNDDNNEKETLPERLDVLPPHLQNISQGHRDNKSTRLYMRDEISQMQVGSAVVGLTELQFLTQDEKRMNHFSSEGIFAKFEVYQILSWQSKMHGNFQRIL